MNERDPSTMSLWALYRAELEAHSVTLTDGLIALEQEAPDAAARVGALMRAAHSIKGAARVVRHMPAVDLAHAMEDRLVALQAGRALRGQDIQHLLDAVDLLRAISPEDEALKDQQVGAARGAAATLVAVLSGTAPARSEAASRSPEVPPAAIGGAPRDAVALPAESEDSTATPAPAPPDAGSDRVVRLTAQALTRLMALTSEATVASRWLPPFSRSLVPLKNEVVEIAAMLESLEDALFALGAGDEIAAAVNEVQLRVERLRGEVTGRLGTLEEFAARQELLHDRLYREIVSTRMRPFGDIAAGFPRVVRDLARQLGKRIRLEVDGRDTQVDRDLAEMLEAPMIQLLRNAVDHGIEPPGERAAAGKPDTGTIRVSAFHRAGMLRVRVADDGRGVDLAALAVNIVERGLTDGPTAERMTERELLAFLFLPGVSTATELTELSGRGVGLDVVQEMVKAVGGRTHAILVPGGGLAFTFDLPLTLSVLQALVVEIAREPYAVPLTRIDRVAVRSRADLRVIEGREYVTIDTFRAGPAIVSGGGAMHEQHVGIVPGRQLLALPGHEVASDDLSIVVLRDDEGLYGLVVDRLIGEQFVVVRPLDSRLGKVRDVKAAALSADGAPLLVLDVDDVIRSIERIVSDGRLERLPGHPGRRESRRKRVLVVDDSITIREIERQILEANGYAVDVAVDGMDGWNAVRTGAYDLVVTDVDMPRLDGIELLRRIRADRRHGALPVMILSYKDRDDDRLRGLDAGASYYLPKSAFQDDRFLDAVDDLIGHAE